MNINKKNRGELKPFFVTNAIPTQSNFEELIDAMVNQKEDGIVKLPGSPVSVEATGDDTSQKMALNLYESFADANPAWTFALRPRIEPNNTETKQGFSIGDAAGASRMFIDRATGNVGVGTVQPVARLHVAGDLCVDGHVQLSTGGAGGVGRLFVDRATGNVGVGTVQPAARLHVAGDLCVDGHVQLKGQIQGEAWKDLTLQGGWKPSDVSQKPGYFKDSNGMVHVRGLVTGGTWAGGATPNWHLINIVFTLPPGYRPEKTCRFANVGGWGMWCFQMNPDGVCWIVWFDGSTIPQTPTETQKAACWLSFDLISFRAYP